MRTIQSFIEQARFAARSLADKLAKATSPSEGRPMRLNPLVALNPRRKPLSGLEIRYVRTQRNTGLSNRAGRSKYDPPKLKKAIAASYMRSAMSAA